MACYGCQVWLLKKVEQQKLLALEMDYLKMSARLSRLQTRKIRSKMQAGKSILKEFKEGNLNGMDSP